MTADNKLWGDLGKTRSTIEPSEGQVNTPVVREGFAVLLLVAGGVLIPTGAAIAWGIGVGILTLGLLLLILGVLLGISS